MQTGPNLSFYGHAKMVSRAVQEKKQLKLFKFISYSTTTTRTYSSTITLSYYFYDQLS